MEGNNVAETYSLIYCFLKQQSQTKAADAVKKAAKAVVVLRDDIDLKGPALEDIIKEWKAKENTKSDGNSESSSEESKSSDDSDSSSEPKDGSGSDSSSGDDSDSESDDDDTSDSNDKSKEETRNSPQKTIERDTSVTLSSAGENAREPAKKVVQIPKQSPDKLTKSDSESNSSDSDDSDEESSSEGSTSDSSDAESSSDDSEDSSSSDSIEENKVNQKDNAAKNKKRAAQSESSSGSESEPQEKEDVSIAKKRKTSGTGAAVTTAVAVESQQTARAPPKKEKQLSTVKERFQRVKVQNMTTEVFLNNGYEAKGGATNDYGERAHRDLIVTRGAGFRKEKNKKKRGSYRGGEITMENHSIKFDF